MPRRTLLLLGELETRITPANTPPALLRDINVGNFGSNSELFTPSGGTVFFTAFDATNGNGLWKTDGTSAGTVLVRGFDAQEPSILDELTDVNGTLYFTTGFSGGRELWKSDGTSAGTVLVADLKAEGGSNPSTLTNVNGTLFFFANNGSIGYELWKTDGTAGGTVLVRDIFSGFVSSTDYGQTSAVNAGGILYFAATDSRAIGFNPDANFELWRSDGTSAGTFVVREIAPSAFSGSDPLELTEFNGRVAFTALNANPMFDRDLWISDGTSAGTIIIPGISQTTASPNPRNLHNFNGLLVFNADDGVNGRELWKFDGVNPGLLADINPNGSSDPNGFENVGSTLFFTAFEPSTGRELWKSNAQPGGTALVANLQPGSFGSYVQDITNLQGIAYFAANAGGSNELWRSDGTSAGTTQIDIDPGSSAFPNQITAAGTNLYFNAFRPDVGFEPFTLQEDIVAPFITQITSTNADGSYYTGASVDISVVFNEQVTLAGGNLNVLLSTGVTIVIPPFIGNVARGTYLVGVGERSFDLDVVSISLDNGATIRDQVNLDANINLPVQNLAVVKNLLINQPNTPPTISPIPSSLVDAGTTVGPLAFTIGDVESPIGNLTVTFSVSASNPPLLGTITLSGTTAERSITVPTLPGVSGVSTITVTVTDEDGASTDSVFTISQNLPPFISDIPDQSVVAGDPLGPINFTIGAGLTPPDQLIVNASTSDGVIIPVSAITFGGSGANRTITIATIPDITAGTTVFVTVFDPNFSGAQATDSFVVNQVANTPPTISPIADQDVDLGTGPVGPIAFTVGDAQTPNALTLSATSSNLTVLPLSGITFGGSGANRTVTLTPAAGVLGSADVTITVSDPQGATAATTFTLTVNNPPPRGFPVGRGSGETGFLNLYNPDLSLRASIQPFGPDFTCGIRVAGGDFNGDGIEDYVVGTGYTPSTQLAVVDGATLKVVFQIAPFGDTFKGGALVSAGDITGDGFPEFAVAAGRGGGARVRVFSPNIAGFNNADGVPLFSQIADFFALIDGNGNPDTAFRGGGRSAIGDFNNDGNAELVFAAGDGGGSRIAIFNGKTLGLNGGPKLVPDFLTFEDGLRNGTYIAAADFNGDGIADLVATPGLGGASRVKVLDGQAILDGQSKTLFDQFVGDSAARGGAHVAARDFDGDGKPELFVGGGPGNNDTVAIFNGQTFAPIASFDPFISKTIPLGVFVG